VGEDKSEVKRLRQMMSQAEQNVEILNDRLVDAKQAQERANLALKDKDDRLAAITKELEAAAAHNEEIKSEHALVVQQLHSQLDRMREQVETLTKKVMELQGQLHESEDRREQDRLMFQRQLAEEQLLMENFRSESEANHIIELLQEREACQMARQAQQAERAVRHKLEFELAREQDGVRALRTKVQLLQQQAAARQVADEEQLAYVRRLELERCRLAEELQAKEAQLRDQQDRMTEEFARKTQDLEQELEQRDRTNLHVLAMCEQSARQLEAKETQMRELHEEMRRARALGDGVAQGLRSKNRELQKESECAARLQQVAAFLSVTTLSSSHIHSLLRSECLRGILCTREARESPTNSHSLSGLWP
jgi:uncharacterized coiled-coil protein SlyX